MIYSDFYIFNKMISILEKDLKKKDYIPICAFILNENRDNFIYSTNKETKKNKIAHAEIKVIEKAYKKNFNLKNSTIFINIEPCLMCLSACTIAEISKIIYLSECEKWGSINDLQSGYLKLKNGKTYPFCEKYKKEKHEILNFRSEKILKLFFKKKRN